MGMGGIQINEIASPRTFEKRAHEAGTRRATQFTQGLSFNLTNALARDGEHLADFFEGALIADQDELPNVTKLVFNPSRQVFS
jgi:hypothetical protein